MDFSKIDPYVALVAAQRNITYAEAVKAQDVAARTEAKLWLWRRSLTILHMEQGIPDQERKATPVLYVDIDSTVRHGYAELGRLVTTANDVVIYPAALAKMKAAKEAGWRIVGITNQGRIALGEMTREQLFENIIETSEQCGYIFDQMMICTHHPNAKELEMAQCWCHKPRIGNIVLAAEAMADLHSEFYPPHMALFVGNQESDRQCAENAGIPFQWAYQWRGEAFAPTPENPNPPPAP